MRIVHIQLRGPYTDNWGYQENILPRCQVRFGDEVYVIATNLMHKKNGEIIPTDVGEYSLEDGVHVVRIKAKTIFGFDELALKLGNYKYLRILEDIKPDIIFVHGLFTGYTSFWQIIKYKKNHDAVVFADNHEFGYFLKERMSLYQMVKRFICRLIMKQLCSVYKKVFCMSPIGVEFARDYYSIPSKLISILPLGFDDQLCDISKKAEIRSDFRKKNGFDESDIIIVHGGKIIPRRRTDLAINSVKKLREKEEKVRLIIFGDIDEGIKKDVKRLILQNKEFVTYMGHLSQKEYLSVFMSCDIGLFPGAPSSLREEAVGCGLYIVSCNEFDLEYLNVNGNVSVCSHSTKDLSYEMDSIIKESKYLIENNAALLEARKKFSYMEMAKRIRKLAIRK